MTPSITDTPRQLRVPIELRIGCGEAWYRIKFHEWPVDPQVLAEIVAREVTRAVEASGQG